MCIRDSALFQRQGVRCLFASASRSRSRRCRTTRLLFFARRRARLGDRGPSNHQSSKNRYRHLINHYCLPPAKNHFLESKAERFTTIPVPSTLGRIEKHRLEIVLGLIGNAASSVDG